ncbi:MAG: alkaline phosphatase family protein [Solirubrobacteraceae bacterium]
MLAAVLATAAVAILLPSASLARNKHVHGTGSDGLGIKPGKIKHVWLIILENKSYDATFTGLNHNTYLWRTLPAQGVLLKNYYGTGHGSFDNYLTLVSGQATQPDAQVDCPYYDSFSGHVDRSGSLATDRDYGQFVSAQGPNAAPGSNGCVYPASVPTLFDQLDAAHVSWKGYAQDLGNRDLAASGPTHDAGVRYCGAPYATPGLTGATAQPNPAVANATDQYLAKHFPFPWFESIRQAGDCNSRHIANLFSPTNGLYHDLQHEPTTPAFSWIWPNMCSDGHDAVCYGNNLSGGFTAPNTTRRPVNYTGGLYAADLFLEHVIPEIEASPAFRDGGLIDITFDEAFPPFTYTGDSFANSTIVAPDAASIIARDDSAGETLSGRRVHFEPTGPNTPLAKNAAGDELYPGPGGNDFIDRPDDCVAQTVPRQPAGTCILLGGGHVPGARTDAATAAAGSATIADNAIRATDRGRPVTGTGIPAGAFVGQVSDTFTPATTAAANGGLDDLGSFALVDSAGDPLPATAAVSAVVLGARTPQTDPLYDATDPTPGGGDTGSVLISPFIRPGSVSTAYYNHYSWLRTIEDLFNVSRASKGLDGEGHIGYAAQPGLAPFGSDVFNYPQGRPTPQQTARYGAIPSWLTTTTAAVEQTVRASDTHPALAIQGATVSIRLRRARLLATTVGPSVPREGRIPVPATSPSTFTVTFSRASAVVALSQAQFTIVDELGHVHHPTVTAIGGGAPPRLIRPGQTVALTAHSVLPTGEGRLTWAPDRARPIVAWDFDLEID